MYQYLCYSELQLICTSQHHMAATQPPLSTFPDTAVPHNCCHSHRQIQIPILGDNNIYTITLRHHMYYHPSINLLIPSITDTTTSGDTHSILYRCTATCGDSSNTPATYAQTTTLLTLPPFYLYPSVLSCIIDVVPSYYMNAPNVASTNHTLCSMQPFTYMVESFLYITSFFIP
jgi:hypothetical protein